MLERILEKRKCPNHWCRNNVQNRFALIVPSPVCFYHTLAWNNQSLIGMAAYCIRSFCASKRIYVQSVSEAHSLKLVHYDPTVDFRYENGVGVQGHIFVMQKQASDTDQDL
jgi:hypothetical protein